MNYSAILNYKKAVYHTLGCKLNFAETATLSDELKSYGVKTANKNEKADICIINTCSVTEMAEHKCRQIIRKLSRENPGVYVVVVGCYAQRNAKEILVKTGADLVLGNEFKGELVKIMCQHLSEKKEEQVSAEDFENHNAISVPTKNIHTFFPSCSRGNRTRYFLKVQDGCDYYCTYCIIPYLRGKSRNGSISSIVKEAENVVNQGGKEIVLTGVNTGDFGRSTGETFLQLIQALDKIKGIERYRISSIEPNLLTDEIIEFCAKSRAFMPHFHIPLQSGSDKVLSLMHRRYDTALFAHKINKIKTIIPEAFIGVDVIVGTRGETKEYFEESYNFIKSLDVSQLHVFSYSERPGTLALKIPHVVTPQEKHARSQHLLKLSDEKRKRMYEKYIGKERDVLWEHGKEENLMHGYTDNYIRAEWPKEMSKWDNTIQKVHFTGFNESGDALICKSL